MADSKEEILYQLKIEENRALRSLTKVKEGVKTLDRRTTKYKETVKEQIRLESQLASIRKQRIQVNKGVEKSVKDLTKAQVQKKNAVGASTSATLELGRVLSDMPYGIRGVANNLQQLASNLFFMSKATDAATGKAVGFGGAISRLIGGLIGPAGILIAFQGIIAAFDYFSNNTKKAEDDLSNFGGTVAKSGSNLKILRQALAEGTISTEEANKAVNKANLEYKDLNLKLDENNQLTKDSVERIDDKIDAIERLAKAQALQTLLEAEYEKIGKARADLDADLAEKGLKLKDLEIRKKEFEAKLEGKQGTARRKLQRDFLRVNEKQGFKLIDNFNKIETKGKKSIDSLVDQLNEEDLFDELFKGKGKDSGEKFAGKFVESYYNEIAGIADVTPDEDGDGISDTAKLSGKLVITPTFVEPEEEFYEKIDRFIERYQTIMSGLTDFVDGEFERQLTIEQNKTNILNEELNNRLLNESLSADQRKSIQNEIAQNDERLRVRQEAIKKKAFNAQKAFNISAALIETYAAASSAYKNTLANPINKLLPDAGLLRAKINAGVATAGGLLQVAAIARQKYQSSSAATPINVGGGGGASGASERSEPSFNIVGRSGENLLINAIQAQFGKPLKAYVVSRDVTTQQQLDGMIVGQAGT
jgi:hypothetical protein